MRGSVGHGLFGTFLMRSCTSTNPTSLIQRAIRWATRNCRGGSVIWPERTFRSHQSCKANSLNFSGSSGGIVPSSHFGFGSNS
ncbi:hypothetical protein BDV36DRAFT_247320 [Aspergillus pseudocaelatus]|uniref:Secreted protein n=1 Tax=Aspergillus pseudocaelatus TaxID=1825620 RepID=A0ABQ6WX79_9EURO|nr:hypothetical protein BDV36DRAFT_247320 [Aspergillus pseudocaelatus]